MRAINLRYVTAKKNKNAKVYFMFIKKTNNLGLRAHCIMLNINQYSEVFFVMQRIDLNLCKSVKGKRLTHKQPQEIIMLE